MPLPLRSLLLAWACMFMATASASSAPACRDAALETLRAASPNGYAVFQRVKDKGFFFTWIDCADAQLGLPNAVHESVHYVTAETDAFPLVGGGEVRRPHAVSRFFAPSRIAEKFKASDFRSTYLGRGGASSATDFLYLLDELNAYTHDLDTAVRLKHLRSENEDVSHRDGLAAVMAFVAVYVQTAEESEPATWSGLRQPEAARVVSELWGRAETVMASSCGIPGFGTEDRAHLRQLCQAGPQASLGRLLGRPALCPTACLGPSPKTVLRDEPRR